jgi:hypothetical protein
MAGGPPYRGTGCPVLALLGREPNHRSPPNFRSDSHQFAFPRCPFRFNLHNAFEARSVVPKAGPRPIFRFRDQPPRHWVAMHIPQLLNALLLGPDVEIIVPRLPEGLGCAKRELPGAGCPVLALLGREMEDETFTILSVRVQICVPHPCRSIFAERVGELSTEQGEAEKDSLRRMTGWGARRQAVECCLAP